MILVDVGFFVHALMNIHCIFTIISSFIAKLLKDALRLNCQSFITGIFIVMK